MIGTVNFNMTFHTVPFVRSIGLKKSLKALPVLAKKELPPAIENLCPGTLPFPEQKGDKRIFRLSPYHQNYILSRVCCQAELRGKNIFFVVFPPGTDRAFPRKTPAKKRKPLSRQQKREPFSKKSILPHRKPVFTIISVATKKRPDKSINALYTPLSRR